MKPRHLAIFLPSLDGGGAERVMLTLAERFVARGVRCDLVVARNEGQLRDRVPAGVRLFDLQSRKPIRAVAALIAYLRRERPQTLLSTTFSANLAAILASKLARTARVVIREANHASIDIKASSVLSTWVNKLVARILYQRADSAIAVAQSVAQSLREGRYVEDDRIHVIVNPAVLADPTQSSVHPAAAHADRRTLVACGRLEAQKDYPTMLRAFAQLRARRNVRLLVLGEGSLHEALNGLARELGIQADVTFAGFDPNARERMANADAFVHTARFEGMSNVLLEALASGCPIVATDCIGGSSEVLDHGRYGTLVPVGDVNAIAVALEQVLDGSVTFPDARDHLQRFDPERVADEYLSVLFPDD